MKIILTKEDEVAKILFDLLGYDWSGVVHPQDATNIVHGYARKIIEVSNLKGSIKQNEDTITR